MKSRRDKERRELEQVCYKRIMLSNRLYHGVIVCAVALCEGQFEIEEKSSATEDKVMSAMLKPL